MSGETEHPSEDRDCLQILPLTTAPLHIPSLREAVSLIYTKSTKEVAWPA